MTGIRRWVVSRASGGRYDPSCFRLDEQLQAEPAQGELLVETRLLSLDPTHLNWVKLVPDLQYLPIGIGDPMIGTNIGIVQQSNHPDFTPGQTVIGTWGWEELAVANATMVRPALPASEMPLEDQLTLLSHVGQAAGGGMLLIGGVTAGDNVLVSAAAGATGSIAAQIAKAMGCRTVGVAGGEAKCAYLLDELGLDAAIDHRRGELEAAVRDHFPQGVDLFFDNVGGEILDAVLANMAPRCRIVVCGAIAQYDSASVGSFTGIRNLPMLIFRQARMEGFVAGQFGEQGNAEVIATLRQLHASGKLRSRTHVVAFDDMPEALTMLLNGTNNGKLIARVR